MKNLTKFSAKACTILLYFLPAALFFSYHPVITIGRSDYMNLEFSLPEIWLIIFAIAAMPLLKKLYKFYGLKKLAIAAVIPVFCLISSIWSANHLRAILTSAILFLLTFTVLNTVMLFKGQKTLRKDLIRVLLFSATAISVVCWAQCILDLLGVSREITLLCKGGTYAAFGFPHPNGFAIEPQFMGNLLLAPILLCYYAIFTHAYKSSKQKAALILLTAFLTSTLFLTLSRGAIFSFGVGALVLVIYYGIKKCKHFAKSLIASILIVIASLGLTLTADGIFASVSPTNDTFVSGVTKAVHQLSLGVIDLRPEGYKDLSQDIAPETSVQETTSEIAEPSTFSGYVAESTDTRLNLNALAFGTWESNPQYVFIGTGLGSAGIAMNKAYTEEIGPKEIVQNEYVSLLLELGIIGCAIILAVAIYAAIKLPKNPLFIAIIFAFVFSLLFFSGLPNALHIYLFPLLFATKDKLLVEDKVKSHRNNRN